MQEADVLVSDDDTGVRTVTLNRPDALNAFNRALFDGVRVALTGVGRAFTAGSDIASDDDGAGAADPYEPFIQAVESFPKPLVAAVNGLAVGIGTTMLGHCDLVLAAASARFRVPFTSLGLVPEAGSTATLPALLGRQRATHAFLTSSWISAADAAQSGLVWKLTEDADLADETARVCAEIAAQPLESLVATKRLLLDARLPAALEARGREEPEFRRLTTRPAHREALAAFRERRKPDFSNMGA
jgi:enoyl-CoA hydratase/carnithine racemase